MYFTSLSRSAKLGLRVSGHIRDNILDTAGPAEVSLSAGFRSCRGRGDSLYGSLLFPWPRQCGAKGALGRVARGAGKERKPVPFRLPEPFRAICRPLFVAAVCSALGGCAGFWDDITSREFKFKDVFKPAPDPMTVIRTSNDGDKKSRALRSLREPLRHGGTQQQQDELVKVLIDCAARDPQPLCRLAAIATLQHFKDPRAAQGLIDAYLNAGRFDRERPEVVATIQAQALAGMGVNGNPVVVETLVRVLNAPPEVGNDKNRQENLEQRIVAARALAYFPQYQAAEALVTVLRKDQDVALRDRATESLREMTGQELSGDAQAWADFLHKSGKEGLAKKPSLGDKILKLVSFGQVARGP
jgi:hypothetical protein